MGTNGVHAQNFSGARIEHALCQTGRMHGKGDQMFSSAVLDFTRSMEALRDLLSVVRGSLADHLDGASKEGGKVFLRVSIDAVRGAADLITGERVAELQLLADKAFGEGAVNVQEAIANTDYASTVLGVSDEALRVPFDRAAFMDMDEALDKMTSSIEKVHLLLGSSLLMLASITEWFVCRLIEQYYSKYPDAADSGEKAFTLSQLKQFDGVEDAEKYLASQKVVDIMYGSVGDWVAWFKKERKLDLGFFESQMPAITEVFQRRHLLIHNGGVVNRLYLANVAPELREGIAAGDSIPVDPAYINSSSQLLEVAFCGLACQFWKQLEPKSEARTAVMLDVIYDRLVAGRDSCVEGLCQCVLNDKNAKESHLLTARVNYWLALKRQGRIEEVRSEIEAADYSAKAGRFRLARLALLDEVDRVLADLPAAYRSDEVTIGEFVRWPLFADVREDQRCEKLLKKLAKERQPSRKKPKAPPLVSPGNGPG